MDFNEINNLDAYPKDIKSYCHTFIKELLKVYKKAQTYQVLPSNQSEEQIIIDDLRNFYDEDWEIKFYKLFQKWLTFI